MKSVVQLANVSVDKVQQTIHNNWQEHLINDFTHWLHGKTCLSSESIASITTTFFRYQPDPEAKTQLSFVTLGMHDFCRKLYFLLYGEDLFSTSLNYPIIKEPIIYNCQSQMEKRTYCLPHHFYNKFNYLTRLNISVCLMLFDVSDRLE